MKIQFSKMHGLGNDFVIINNLDLQYRFNSVQICKLADRKFGIGCDQVLIVDRPTNLRDDFFYRIYNSDGTEASQCGNGARCFIRFVHDQQLTAKTSILLQTSSRGISGRICSDDTIEVMMGEPDFITANIPLLQADADYYEFNSGGETIRFAALSVGNPHAVIRLSEAELLSNDAYLTATGLLMQQSGMFPDGVNVNFVYLIDRENISLRTFERGAGLTFACGSGACAAVAVLIRDDATTNEVKVTMPGGQLRIAWTAGQGVLMRGTATHVFDGEIILCP